VYVFARWHLAAFWMLVELEEWEPFGSVPEEDQEGTDQEAWGGVWEGVAAV
jgi:hypothetical protein